MGTRVLVVDDDRGMCEWLERALPDLGFEVTSNTSAEAALESMEDADLDVVVADVNMRGMGGIELAGRVRAARPDLPVIMVTAFGSLDIAIEAIRAGAYDFVPKPFELEQLGVAIERAAEHHRLTTEVKRLRRTVEDHQGYTEMIGQSPAMQALYDRLNRIADSDASVLITGESGVGKELVARALHARGKHSAGPFVAVNCAAIPETLIESELFGHARGAFTDARGERTGLFLQADRGTLFLDEVGELPLALQPKLLRAVEERTVRPVGAGGEVRVNLRLICATNRDLESRVDAGQFREDLYFRINVIQVQVPPLRARGDDVLLIAQRLLEKLAARSGKDLKGFSTGVARQFLAYPWPGNVRELRNVLEHAVALARLDSIVDEDLPERLRAFRPSHVLVASDDPGDLVPLETVEQRYILRVLESVGGNKRQAAKILGLDRKTLYRKLERYGVQGEPEAE